MMLTQGHQQVNFANFYFGHAKREVGTVSKEAAAHNSGIVDSYNVEEVAIVGNKVFYSIKFSIIDKAV